MFPVFARNGKENADMCRCRTWLRFPRLERRGRFECVLNIYGVEYVRHTNSLFLTLTCGVFVFSSVSAFLLRLPSSHPSHSLTLISLTHSHTHSLTHTHSHIHSLTHHSLTHARTHSLTDSLTYSLTHSLTVGQCALPRGRMYALATMSIPKGSDVRPGVPWAPPPLRGRRGTMCIAKGSDVRPGVPWAPRLLRGTRGTMCIAKGSDVRPASLALRLFCVAGVGQCALPRGRRRGTMCIAKGSDARPAMPWRPLGSASFAWQAWDNVHGQGVGCMPWRPLGSASFAWQAWGNVHCQGVGCTPCVPWAPRLLRGRRGTMCIAKGWAPPLLRGRRATMCIAKGSDVRPGAPCAPPLLRGRGGTMCIAKGSNVRPGVPWALPLLRGRRGTMCIAKGRMYALASLGLPPFCMGGVGQCALPRGWMYALASPGLRLFCVALTHSPTHPLTHWLTHSLTHPPTHSLTHSFTHSLTHSLTLSLSLTRSFTDSLAHSFTHSGTHSLTHTHHAHITHSHSHSLTCACTYIHTHTNSPTSTPPSLLYFLFPSFFSVLSLSLEKLVTCGVIRSYNFAPPWSHPHELGWIRFPGKFHYQSGRPPLRGGNLRSRTNFSNIGMGLGRTVGTLGELWDEFSPNVTKPVVFLVAGKWNWAFSRWSPIECSLLVLLLQEW